MEGYIINVSLRTLLLIPVILFGYIFVLFDEPNCILVQPSTRVAPPREKTGEIGSTITIECEAVGVPTPLIVWRLNWGHIPEPPRVTSTSVNGRGVLTIRNLQETDQGAYTCEALNSRGSIFIQPDTIVMAKRRLSICFPTFCNYFGL